MLFNQITSRRGFTVLTMVVGFWVLGLHSPAASAQELEVPRYTPVSIPAGSNATQFDGDAYHRAVMYTTYRRRRAVGFPLLLAGAAGMGASLVMMNTSWYLGESTALYVSMGTHLASAALFATGLAMTITGKKGMRTYGSDSESRTEGTEGNARTSVSRMMLSPSGMTVIF